VLYPSKYEFYRRIPSIIFIAKFGISMGMLATNLSIHTDTRIFPIKRR
jgi:hypothetical protein